ncbi:MAG: type II toxin-antitoxin system HicA family toxin [Candidatus Berkelbacteria bacterium]|nr:type II toxin-antitoxin system HicA family toxin [Candidatus Berkelbacteria bacterium]
MTKIKDHGWKDAVRVLKEFGFQYEGTQGDHDSYSKPGQARPVIVPRKASLPDFIVANILRTARISRKDYAHALSPGKKKLSRRAKMENP